MEELKCLRCSKWFYPVIKPTKLKKNEFKCSICGNVYKKEREGWSEEEAIAEKDELFGKDVPLKDCGIVCDDCFKKMGL